MTTEGVDKRPRVLVVEDIATTRNAYVRHLRLQGGYRVDTAEDLDAAMAAVHDCTYHVALVDIMLAGEHDVANRDGLAVLEYVRDLGEGTQPIVISGQRERQLVRDFLKEFAAFDFIDKKVLADAGMSKLIEVVDKAVSEGRVGAKVSWPDLVSALVVDTPEAVFVSELMQRLDFQGGFENLSRTLINVLTDFMPLRIAIDSKGLIFDPNVAAFSGDYWSKGQGQGVRISVTGKPNSVNQSGESQSILMSREKSGLRVVVSAVPTAPRGQFK